MDGMSAERVVLDVFGRLDRPTVDALTVAVRARMRADGAGYIRTYHVDEHVDALLADGTLRLGEDGRLDRRRPLRAAAAQSASRGITFYSTDFRGAHHMDMRRSQG